MRSKYISVGLLLLIFLNYCTSVNAVAYELGVSVDDEFIYKVTTYDEAGLEAIFGSDGVGDQIGDGDEVGKQMKVRISDTSDDSENFKVKVDLWDWTSKAFSNSPDDEDLSYSISKKPSSYSSWSKFMWVVPTPVTDYIGGLTGLANGWTYSDDHVYKTATGNDSLSYYVYVHYDTSTGAIASVDIQDDSYTSVYKYETDTFAQMLPTIITVVSIIVGVVVVVVVLVVSKKKAKKRKKNKEAKKQQEIRDEQMKTEQARRAEQDRLATIENEKKQKIREEKRAVLAPRIAKVYSNMEEGNYAAAIKDLEEIIPEARQADVQDILHSAEQKLTNATKLEQERLARLEKEKRDRLRTQKKAELEPKMAMVENFVRQKDYSSAITELEKILPQAQTYDIQDLYSHAQQRLAAIQMLDKLMGLFSISENVNINDVAGILEISRSEVLKKLVEWGKNFPIKIDGDIVRIKTEDVTNLLNVLDQSYQDWTSEPKMKMKKD